METTIQYRMKSWAIIALYAASHPQKFREIAEWMRYRKVSPLKARMPWWPKDARLAVARGLPDQAAVFEYGSGGSTMWMRDLGHRVVSVEHDPEWYATITKHLPEDAVVHLYPPESTGVIRSVAASGFFDRYVDAIRGEPDETLDLVIVDGRCRVDCAIASIPKVKPGGMLLLDDSDRDRYREVFQRMVDWPYRHYSGVKIGGERTYRTTIWTRPHHERSS